MAIRPRGRRATRGLAPEARHKGAHRVSDGDTSRRASSARTVLLPVADLKIGLYCRTYGALRASHRIPRTHILGGILLPLRGFPATGNNYGHGGPLNLTRLVTILLFGALLPLTARAQFPPAPGTGRDSPTPSRPSMRLASPRASCMSPRTPMTKAPPHSPILRGACTRMSRCSPSRAAKGARPLSARNKLRNSA